MKRPERPSLRKPLNAGSVLSDLLTGAGLGDKMKGYRAWQCWDEVVGPQIADHARPKRLRNGVLEVSVDQPIWMQQLRLMAPQILERLNRALKGEIVKEIYWRRGKPTRPIEELSEPDRPQPLPQLDKQEQAKIDKVLAEIKDADIRSVMEDFLEKQAKLDKQRRNRANE
ncbi:MAG: hypothetical protein C0616_07640 [Desulfuromonas sp.]|nr:MAG: hypothetical protein C0616_07640 [Desulfuromonas sp.]